MLCIHRRSYVDITVHPGVKRTSLQFYTARRHCFLRKSTGENAKTTRSRTHREEPAPRLRAWSNTLDMEVLREWLQQRGFWLQQNRDVSDIVVFHPNRIVFIDQKNSYSTRLVTLLHECGHVAIHLRRNRTLSKRVAGTSRKEELRQVGRGSPRSTRLKIATLDEEIAAWEWGQRLGHRLGVRYSNATFERVRARCLMTYVRWGAGKVKKQACDSSGSALRAGVGACF